MFTRIFISGQWVVLLMSLSCKLCYVIAVCILSVGYLCVYTRILCQRSNLLYCVVAWFILALFKHEIYAPHWVTHNDSIDYTHRHLYRNFKTEVIQTQLLIYIFIHTKYIPTKQTILYSNTKSLPFQLLLQKRTQLKRHLFGGWPRFIP